MSVYQSQTLTDDTYIFKQENKDFTHLATVSSLLGHAQVSTTLDIYSHAFDKNRKMAAEGLHNGLGV